MPLLREWMLLPHRCWNADQLESYIRDSTANLAAGMVPVVQITSPQGAANILLTVLVRIARDNPQWRGAILSAMADVADALADMPALPLDRVH